MKTVRLALLLSAIIVKDMFCAPYGCANQSSRDIIVSIKVEPIGRAEANEKVIIENYAKIYAENPEILPLQQDAAPPTVEIRLTSTEGETRTEVMLVGGL